jgi:hypothetical protein
VDQTLADYLPHSTLFHLGKLPSSPIENDDDDEDEDNDDEDKDEEEDGEKICTRDRSGIERVLRSSRMHFCHGFDSNH